MTTFTESIVEEATLEWLAGLGWQVAHGPDIAPGTPNAERSDYDLVVLERRLRDALAELNPALPAAALDERITQAIPFMRATASPDEIERFRLQRGDVLITKDSETWDDIGVPALVTEESDDLICGYHLALLRPIKQMLGPYLARTLQTKMVAYQFHVAANGVTRFGLTHGSIESVLLPLPPFSEQAAIVDYLDKAISDIDTAITRARRQIELLQEYRTRLIADVVTGKLDVREAAAQLPDVTDDEEPMDEGGPLAGSVTEGLYDPDESVEELAMESEVTA